MFETMFLVDLLLMCSALPNLTGSLCFGGGFGYAFFVSVEDAALSEWSIWFIML